ncbi:MAG: DUF2306 domain-containing protein [Anaerolineales bacterium]|nr:DUF2306 domain-containing protein [Anaerolineales bacterium]
MTYQMSKRIGWGIMTLLALGIVLVASRYFSGNPDVFFPEQRDVYLAHRAGILMHILGGVLALGLGPFQFLTTLRTRRPTVHRWIGRFYLVGILLGGVAGLFMAFYAYAGISASLGFASLAILWLTTGFMAYRTIRAGDTAAHRRWMIRNFALTFAAVTLRLESMPLSMLFGQTTGYDIVAWSCWIPNLLIAEGIVRGWLRRQQRQTPLTAGTAS